MKAGPGERRGAGPSLRFRTGALAALLSTSAAGCGPAGYAGAQDIAWAPHDPDRPRPPIVDPGPAPPAAPVPADAIVLFDGGGLEAWQSESGSEARWRVGDGWFEVEPGLGSLRTRAEFGDVQLHVEWASPADARGDGQDRGNSGVYLMARYELQVLDSYGNETYADGQAGAVYGQFPPLANASRAAGEWQAYDILFQRPRFDSAGRLVSPAYMTVLHNGVLIHDHVALTGPTAHRARPPYEAHAARLPVLLQDHGARVRFRNIWVRDLER